MSFHGGIQAGPVYLGVLQAQPSFRSQLKGCATMATALFQCISEDVARNMERCLPVAPVEVTDFRTFGNLSCIVFTGDCGNMYWWCMDISSQSPRTVSFIGVDEDSCYADDPYKLAMLYNVPRMNILRTEAQEHYYSDLVEKFMSAITHFEFDDSQLARICSQCVLGQDENNSAGSCITKVKMCMSHGRQGNYRNLLSIDDEDSYSSVGQNTLVRVMAHICYLDKAIGRGQSQVGSSVGRFLSFIFGR